MSALKRVLHEAPETKLCAYCRKLYHRDRRCTWTYWEKSKYCSRECYGKTVPERASAKRLSFEDTFASYVLRSNNCWEWTGLKDKDGYGLFNYKQKQYRAARTALSIDGRIVPDGMYACHHCDNPSCVKPSHLYIGTPKDNSRDAIVRNRNRRGERSHFSKLTDDIVRHIRTADKCVGDLAKEYNVSHSAISLVRSRKTWKHIE